jgi:hypothetical protein
MIKTLVNQIMPLKSVKKVFMNKRDIKIYDNSWNNVSEARTEYDVEIIIQIIDSHEWRLIAKLEKEIGQRFPDYKVNYHLIESEPNKSTNHLNLNGKLIYDSETNRNLN